MLVLVCGMHRSGSTLVWQIARLLLEDRPGLRSPRDVEIADFTAAAADPEDLLMAKVHFRSAFLDEPLPKQGAIYLYTYRDLRDAVASLYRKGRYRTRDPRRGPRNSRLAARRELAGDDLWTSMPGVWIAKYEDFRDDIPGLVRNLASTLGVQVSEERVSEICAEVDVDAQRKRLETLRGAEAYDETRITTNHITDGREGAWRDTLVAGEVAAIESEAGPWLVEHGYEVETDQGRASVVRSRRKAVAERRAAAEARGAAVPAKRRRVAPAVTAHARIKAGVLGAVAAVLTVLAIGLGSSLGVRIVLSILSVGFAAATGVLVGRVVQNRRDNHSS